MEPTVSIIIVNYNTKKLISNCLNSIYKHVRKSPVEIVVVDNASTDGSSNMIKEKYPGVVLVRNKENVGFGIANNIGVSHSKGTYLMFLNSDALLLEDTVSIFLNLFEKYPSVGLLGPSVILNDGKLQPKTCGNFPNVMRIFNDSFFLSKLSGKIKLFEGIHINPQKLKDNITEVDWISGVCMFTSREVFQKIGGFDPKFFMYAEDIDLCWRCKKNGWHILRINSTVIKHLCGGSSTTVEQKVRNSILQQRNLLNIISMNHGIKTTLLIKIILFFGLFLRSSLAFPGLLIGNDNCKIKFRTSIARIKDILEKSGNYT